MSSPVTAHVRGVAAVAAAATLWGVSGVVAKSLFRADLGPETLMALRLSGAAALALALAAACRPGTLRPLGRHLPALALLGGIIAMTQFSYYQAIHFGSVPVALFLQYLGPVLLVLYGRAAGTEPLTIDRAGAVALSAAGSYLLVSAAGALAVTPLGVAWGLFSAACFAAYTVYARRRVAELDPWAVLGVAMGFGALLWIAVVPPWQAWLRPYPPAAWWMIAHIVVVATLVPFALFLSGLRHVPASVAGLTAMVEPVAGTAAAYLILGDVLSLGQIAGCALILAGVAWVRRAGGAGADVPDPA
jgi:drug/metabolite transporter (DMT)-like permease